MSRLLPGVLLTLVVGLAPAAAPADAAAPSADGRAAAHAKVPDRAQWMADVKAVMKGSRGYLRTRVAAKDRGERLAINFDIDNTVIATYYDGGGAIPVMLHLSKLMQRLGVSMVFNTGRSADQYQRTLTQLTRAGFPVAELCLRNKGEGLPVGKQRCRDSFIDKGFTLVANVGNNDTDFIGDGYEKAYRLPNYNGALG